MRIAVVGFGGVGGYIGAKLTETNHEVIGFARGEHLRVIQNSGIEVIEDDNAYNISINAQPLESADGYFDIVLFCVKSYDLEESYRAIMPSIDTKTTIVSFSNGVSNGDLLRSLSDSRVLDGCLYILSHIEEPGKIVKKGKVFAAVFGGESGARDILKAIFDEANLRTKTPDDIKTAIWKKYIFISAFATMTSFYDKSIGYIYEHKRDEAKALLNEIASVALALGIEITQEIQKSLDTASSVPYDSSTSMRLDFTNKKRDELTVLSGYIVQKGEEVGVKVPIMRRMYKELLTKHIE